MMIRKILAKNLLNYQGFKTPRKCIVLESDDWGSIRMPSRDVFEFLMKKGVPVETCPYSKNDSLASEDDLSLLFELLSSIRDVHGSHPVITANVVVGNPDFEKISKSDFEEYYHEPFTETLSRYPKHGNSFNLWKEGMGKGLFYPQFHGREHVNVAYWMRELKEVSSLMRELFEYQCWSNLVQSRKKINIQASYDTEHPAEIEQHKAIIGDGLALFKKIFGFRSRSFIANNFIYHSDLNESLKNHGVDIIQGMKYQKIPILGKTKRGMSRHYTGEKNHLGQHYLVRNCVFEPSQKPDDFDNVGECLNDISNAFFWKKPAIISIHRLNFVGYLRTENRDRNLKLFRELLKEIMKRWPDVEFMSSVQLGEYIKSGAVRSQEVTSA